MLAHDTNKIGLYFSLTIATSRIPEEDKIYKNTTVKLKLPGWVREQICILDLCNYKSVNDSD